MANYNCTPIGCIQNPSGLYPNLQSCQSVCFKWGCPEQLSADTKLYFIYDASGSYGPDIVPMFTAATAYTTTLQSNGWQGDAYHILTSSEDWLHWPTAVYKHDLVRNGLLTSPPFGQTNCWDITGLPPEYGREFHIFDVENDNTFSWNSQILQSSNGTPANQCYCPTHITSIVGGGVKKAEYDENIIVVTIIDQSFNIEGGGYGVYDQGFTLPSTPIGTGFASTPTGDMPMMAYAAGYMWHYVTMSGVTANGGSLKSVMLPRSSSSGGGGTGNWHTSNGWESKERKFALGITAAIDSGNQDITAAGGTGTLDGTWIAQTGPGSILGPNSICAIGMTQDTDPTIHGSYTYVGVTGVEIENPYWSTPTAQYFPFYTNMGGGGGADPLCMYWDPSGMSCFYDPAWPVDPNTGVAFAESPTGIWGGLDQLGWTYDISFSGAQSSDFGNILDSLVGTFINPLTTCVSAETSGTIDYPYSTEVSCESICFPQGLTSYDCGAFGCYSVPLNSGSFINLSACTASCTSYTCTMTGCTLGQGTGGTATLSACTGSCFHYECTDNCGCVAVPGYGNLSLDYAYATQGQCDEGCIAWKCYDDLGLTPNTKLYVVYDTSSMDQTQVRNAYWGIQDYLTQQGLLGNAVASDDILQQHTHFHNERWLGWHMVPYGIRNLDGTDSVANGYIQSNVLWGQWVEEDFMKWAYGVEINGPYPNPLHFGSPRNNPASPMTTNTAGIGQPTTVGMTNTNPANPNYTYLQQIHPQFWVQTAKTTDDVVMIIFADESDNKYHDSSMTLSQAPKTAWKVDYNHFLTLYDIVNQPCTGSSIYTTTTLVNPPAGTGTTSGGSGSFKAFVYPTAHHTVGVTNKQKAFNLHVLAGISVGNLLDVDTNTPFTGIWSAGTAPKTTGVGVWNANNDMSTQGTPGYSDFDMGVLMEWREIGAS